MSILDEIDEKLINCQIKGIEPTKIIIPENLKKKLNKEIFDKVHGDYPSYAGQIFYKKMEIEYSETNFEIQLI